MCSCEQLLLSINAQYQDPESPAIPFLFINDLFHYCASHVHCRMLRSCWDPVWHLLIQTLLHLLLLPLLLLPLLLLPLLLLPLLALLLLFLLCLPTKLRNQCNRRIVATTPVMLGLRERSLRLASQLGDFRS